MSDCGNDLIKAKDNIHSFWFFLQQNKITKGDYIYLPKMELDKILQISTQSFNRLRECTPDSRYLDRIQSTIEYLTDTVQKAEKPKIKEQQYYKVDLRTAKEIITSDINKLANNIHRAGSAILEYQGEYAGCRIVTEAGEEPDISSINTGALAYCEGTLRLGRQRGMIHPPGNKVEHRPGTATSHANVVEFEQGEEGKYDVRLNYTESGDNKWRTRQEYILDYLERHGFKCDGSGELEAQCKGALSEDDIRHMAIYISQIVDIDLQPEECIGLIFDVIKENTEKLSKLDKDSIWNTKWKIPCNEPAIIDCRKEAEAEEKERKKQEFERKTRADMEYALENMNYNKQKALSADCEYSKYQAFNEAYYFLNWYSEQCGSLYRDSVCHDVEQEERGLLDEVAREIVATCPPGPIIEEKMSQGDVAIYSQLASIKNACRLAGDDECLESIAKAINEVEIKDNPQLCRVNRAFR